MNSSLKSVLKNAALYFCSILSIIVGGLTVVLGFLGIFYQLLWYNSFWGMFWFAVIFLAGAFTGCFGLALFHHLYKNSHASQLNLNGYETIAKSKEKSLFN